MARSLQTKLLHLGRNISNVMTDPPALAFVPALCLSTYWFGGEGALLICAIAIPIAYLCLGGFYGTTNQLLLAREGVTGLLQTNAFNDLATQVLQKTSEFGWKSAVFLFEIEDFAELQDRFGKSAADQVQTEISERLIAALRDKDSVGKIDDVTFGVCLDPVRHLDLELCIQMAARLQRVSEEPISIDGTVIYASVSVGFCQHTRSPAPSGEGWLAAAATALKEATRHGPSGIRAFTDRMVTPTADFAALIDEVASALENGQIMPWFQPQISTETGQISGFEALARWSHPTRGTLLPSDFLPALEQADLLERLADVMMFHAFSAVQSWDHAGLHVPQIGVNFAGSELSNPLLIKKICWELDRFDLTPARLAIEVLETVVASAPDDMITRNINALGELGCRIDLDDFGTGHASITSIRRFGVNRIKIDRSFVIKADRDPEQQRMISAILTMAERLGVETLAEGVETVGEHVILAQLGCDHVQGYGIAHPMPADQTVDWIKSHNAKLRDVPRIMSGKA